MSPQFLLLVLAELWQSIEQPLLLAIRPAFLFLYHSDYIGNVFQVRNVLLTVQSHRHATCSTRAARSSYAVNVRRARSRNVVIDDAINTSKVDASRQQICGDENPNLA